MNSVFRFLAILVSLAGASQIAHSQWIRLQSFEDGLVRSFAAIDTTLFVGTDGALYRSTDKGICWTAVGFTSTGVRTLRSIPDGKGEAHLFAGNMGSNAALFLSTDIGTTWTLINSGMPQNQRNVDALAVICPSGINGKVTLFAGNLSGVFRSTDGGANWTTVKGDFGNHAVVQALAVCADGTSGTNIIAGTNWNGIWLSTDNGTSWIQAAPVTVIKVSCLAVMGTNVFAGISNGGVLHSTNSGATWQSTGPGIPDLGVSALAVSDTMLFAATSGGVFLSTNKGSTWTSILPGGTPLTRFVAVEKTDLYVATADQILGKGTLWRRPISEVIPEVIRRKVPTDFLLLNNYPNPFNPGTTIEYRIPKLSQVSLKVFNSLGQEVAILVNEEKDAGYYQVRWDAALPSGVYFYRFQAGEYLTTKRMILLR